MPCWDTCIKLGWERGQFTDPTAEPSAEVALKGINLDRLGKLGKGVTLVGAHERHNFGDWLLAFTADALIGRTDTKWVNVMGRVGSGISEECGPYLSIWDAAAVAEPRPPVIHVGGETLACLPLSAIHMSLAPDAGESFDPHRIVPLDRSFAYVTPAIEEVAEREIRWGPRVFFGVGGRTLDTLPRELQSALASDLANTSHGFRCATHKASGSWTT